MGRGGLQVDYALLASTWDATVLRHGDSSHLLSHKVVHPNRWNTTGFMRMAWRELSRGNDRQRGRVGVLGSNRASEAMGTLAMFAADAMKQKVDEHDWCAADSLVLRHQYDATPIRMCLRSLQSLIESSARYPVKELDGNGCESWTTVGYE